VPLSDEDLKAIRTVVRDELFAVEQGIDAKITTAITESEARMQEFMRDTETSLLTSFHART